MWSWNRGGFNIWHYSSGVCPFPTSLSPSLSFWLTPQFQIKQQSLWNCQPCTMIMALALVSTRLTQLESQSEFCKRGSVRTVRAHTHSLHSMHLPSQHLYIYIPRSTQGALALSLLACCQIGEIHVRRRACVPCSSCKCHTSTVAHLSTVRLAWS